MNWKARQHKWVEITLARQEAERNSRRFLLYGPAAFIAAYLFFIVVLSLAHPY